ncbi:MAG: thermonuclease family protein [Lachnospiraceae bacterium]|nr:thermonuclease family protein [Lachnospiraceae bacterium]
MNKRQKRYLGIVIALLLAFFAFKTYQSITDRNADEALIEVSLVRVVDGDTIVVKLDEENVKVRLIGINAAESVHSDESKNTEEGKAASEHLKGMLKEGDTLYIQYDVDQYDQYERTLAYVWLEDDVNIDSERDIEKYMLNAILVSQGYAEAKAYPPNTRYAEVFEELE